MLRLFNLVSLSFCFLLAISACDFHLQGEMHLAKPLRRLYLETRDPYGHLARNLKESLKMSQVTLVDSPSDASTILSILQDDTVQNLLSVNSTTQTRQYQLIVIVTFAVYDRIGRMIVPPQTLSESRIITVQSNQILGNSNEATLYQQQMRRALANAIMNRLSSKEITAMINTQVK